MSTNFPDIDISAVAATSSTCTRSRNVRAFQQVYELVLPQFEGPQMIARIVVGSIELCLRFSALFPINHNLSYNYVQFVMRIVNGYRTNFIFKLLGRGRNLAPIYRYAKS